MTGHAYNDHARLGLPLDKPKIVDRNLEAGELIEQRKDFANRSGTFVGIDYPRALLDRLPFGLLDRKYQEEIKELFEEAESVYIVFSYATPIAWTISPPNTVGLRIPKVLYSIVSAHHQGVAEGAA